jgi:hypothetical protein
MLMLANLVRAVAAVVVGIIVIAIVLVLLGANHSNDIVSWFRDAGSWLAGPFRHLFDVGGNKADIAVNWGIAAVVYAVIAGVISSLLARAAVGGPGRYGRRETVVR